MVGISMKTYAKSSFKKLVLMFTLVLFSACSNFEGEHSIPNQKNLSPKGMLSFEGSVFVALTKPSPKLWELAGWQISRNSVQVAEDRVPKDCTLYPHEGVEDQWIGSCTGSTLIPQNGASHIQVMQTLPDGNTILIQVAPTPDN
jgi:hypothetical protein